MEKNDLKLMSQQLPELRDRQIEAALSLLEEGNTIPFIARYRKEATGSLDEVQLQGIQEQWHRVKNLRDRQQTVIKAIEEQGKLTPALRMQIETATELNVVEDLYLPYKKKRRTKAQIAREQGLQPLANWIFMAKGNDLNGKAAEFISQDVPDVQTALEGANEILAETISESSTIRAWLRNYTKQHGELIATVKKGGQELDSEGVYQQYYDFSAPLSAMNSYRVLAINRGEKAKILSVKILADEQIVQNYLNFRLVKKSSAQNAAEFVKNAAAEAYKRFLGPAIERELRRELTDQANEQAIKVFGENLYHLLMQAPIKGKVVLGFDPAYRTGCKLAVLDPNGKLLKVAVIYPHKPAPENQRQQAEGQLLQLIEDYQVEMIAIGNGTASRESERFVAQAIKKIKRPVYYVIVNESGASVYSASQDARDEFPELTVEKRSAISIGRRLQDPLAELVKISPEAIGVGQYQHDLPKTALKVELDAVVERAVNRVGVNLNTASYQLLAHIAGLNATLAKNIVRYRNENGRFTSRMQLKSVPRLGPKAFQQAVGFLRIVDGNEPLDNTDIHPESYAIARQLLQAAGITSELGSPMAAQQLRQLDIKQFVSEKVGLATLKDIIASLCEPGRDLRDSLPAPLLRQDVLTIEDLKPGMQLQGTVRNVVDFGAFVDVGIKHDGLVHVSHLTKKFIQDPRQVVAVGDIVDVWVLSVDLKRQRVQLTMVQPNE